MNTPIQNTVRQPHDAEQVSGPSFERKSRDKGLLIKRFLVFVMPLLVIGAAIVAFVIMGAMKTKPEEKAEEIKAIPVLTDIALQDDVQLSVMSQGEVLPRTRIGIAPQLSGKIAYMSPKFIEGGKFNKGDVLVRLDAAEYELRVVQARANVAQAETVLAREKSEAAIAAQDWHDIGTGQATALTLREPQMAEAAARLEAAKAQLGEAELLLSRTTIVAPFTGRVVSRAVNQGEYVGVGTRLGQVYATNVMDVRLPLTNHDLGQTGLGLGFVADSNNPGLPVTLRANVAGIDREWAGHVVRTDSGFDNRTRVLFAYVEVKDPFGAGADNGVPLAPGIFVMAALNGTHLKDVVVVPRNALRGKDQVYVANSDNTLSIKTVDVVSSDRRKAVLRSGIEPGTAVVTSPIRGVAEGMKINIVETLDTVVAKAGDAP